MLSRCSVRIAAVCAALILCAAGARAQSDASAGRKPITSTAKRSTSPKPAVSPTSPELDPKALDILRSVRDRLAAAHTLSYVAVDTWESRTAAGTPRIQKNRFEVALQRPDRMRVIVSTDAEPRSQVNCNGRTMLTYTVAARAIAITKQPRAINECLNAAYKASSTTDVPAVDPLVAVSPDLSGLKRARYVGQSPLGGTTTDIVAFSRDTVLVQIWVGTDDKLPRAVRVTSAADPNRFRHTLTMSDWQIDVPVGADVFTSLKTVSADHVDGGLPKPVGTTGVVQSAPTDRPLTIHTLAPKYWGSGGSAPSTPSGMAGYYLSPDGYGYYPAPRNLYPVASAPYSEAPCVDCGYDWTEGGPEPGFNISLSTSGWHRPPPPPEENPPAGRFLPGQIVSTLPVGCAAPYRGGPAFYLCGSTWFSGIIGPDGKLYFRVISPPSGY